MDTKNASLFQSYYIFDFYALIYVLNISVSGEIYYLLTSLF